MSDSNRLASRIAVAVCFLLGLFAARSARADEATTRRLVVVLRPSSGSAETWPEGTQAVVAELVAGGYELLLRASVARDRDGLLAELATAASERPVLGAVVVLREGERGIAYVYTQKSGTVPVETGVSEGAVGEGAVALRIAQVLGPPELEVPESRPAPASPPEPDVPAAPATPVNAEQRVLLVAVAAGLVFTSDLSEPLPIAGLELRQRLIGPLSLDAAAALSLGASRIETAAGSVDFSAQTVTLYLSFEPFRDSHFGFSLGLGGGMVWTQGQGVASEGFAASSDAARVALLSARAAATFTHNDWSLLLAVEPGVLLPAVDVSAGSDAVRLGRPWTTTSVGLGWNF
jgi:hypothetical protein